VDEAKAVGTEAGDVVVLNDVVALDVEDIFLFPVAVDRQHFTCAAINRDDVRNCDVVFVIEAVNHQVGLHFIELVTVIISQ